MRDDRKEYFVYIWEFIVPDDRIEAFTIEYGPAGGWVKLFSRSEGYMRTTLLQDSTDPHRFITLDYWHSREARDKFKSTYRSEFEELDKQYEQLTIKENFLGDFYTAL